MDRDEVSHFSVELFNLNKPDEEAHFLKESFHHSEHRLLKVWNNSRQFDYI